MQSNSIFMHGCLRYRLALYQRYMFFKNARVAEGGNNNSFLEPNLGQKIGTLAIFLKISHIFQDFDFKVT